MHLPKAVIYFKVGDSVSSRACQDSYKTTSQKKLIIGGETAPADLSSPENETLEEMEFILLHPAPGGSQSSDRVKSGWLQEEE